MNKTIIDSKSKQKILVVLTQMPQRFFSVKELALRSGLNNRRVKDILSSFSKHGILKSVEKNHSRFYQIDRHSGLFSELSKVFGPEEKSSKPDLLAKVILPCGQIKLAVLSGIFLGMPRSQVDLFLVGKISLKRLEKTLHQLENITGVEINYSIIDENEYIDRLYSFDWFIKEIMENNPVILVDKISSKKKSRNKRLASSFSNIQLEK